MISNIRLNVTITAKEVWDDEQYTQVWNIRERLSDFILGFGNGVWHEIRVVAESQDGLDAFRGLLTKGGFSITSQPMPDATLFQAGDECWAGFVFIDPTPKSFPK